MKWLTQFSLVMRSSMTSLREKIEDPEQMLHQLIIDMEEELDRVRSSVAMAVADEIQMRNRSEREAAEAVKWMDRAAIAMNRNDETSARAALNQKLSADERAQRYASDYARQRGEVEKLQDAVRDLEGKILQALHKKTLLMARIVRAESSQRINAAMERSTSQSALAQFGRLEARVDREEALAEAWDRLDGVDVEADSLKRRFEQQEREEQLDAALASLRAEADPR